MNQWQKQMTQTLVAAAIAVWLCLGLSGCGDRASTQPVFGHSENVNRSGAIAEVSPPTVIQQLRQSLENYQPQVKILSPKTDDLLQDDTVTVQLQVQDLPIFKNAELELGPHLHVILDNQPYKAVYDPNQPLVFTDLLPGTHTLRVFASRPWHESFKNEGAYAQTTFHIFTKTQDNNPDPNQPLLTYSRPKGTYGAEPILLDFYLTNAPLHLVAQENQADEIADWRIRCTINGNSFVLDRWEPIYLEGFKAGKNWVQLEFLDDQGNPVENVFNNTVRVITYEPKGQDTLSKLIRGEISAAAAQGIVDPNYTAKLPEVEPTASPTPEPLPSPTPTPTPSVSPLPEIVPEVEPSPAATEDETAAPTNQKPKGIFERFRRPAAAPSPDLPPTLPEVIETPAPEPATTPQPEDTAASSETPSTEQANDAIEPASAPELNPEELQ